MSKKSKSEGKSASTDAVSPSAGRKRLADVMTSLEKARAKRDKAQARVEALEALADELASRMAADATNVSEARDAEASAAKAARKVARATTPDAPPAAAKPVASKPVANKPVAKKPVASQPVAKKPVASKPVANKPKPDAAPSEDGG